MRDRYQSGSLSCENGVYIVRYYEKQPDGSRPRKAHRLGTVQEFNTKRKAQTAAANFMRTVNERAEVVRFHHLCAIYEAHGMEELRHQVRVNYRSEIKKLCKAFGEQRLDDLTSPAGITAIEAWFKAMRTHQGKPVAAWTRRKSRMVLLVLMKAAMKRGYLTGDQYQRSRLIDVVNSPENTAPKRKRVPLSVDQYHELLAHPDLPSVCKVVLRICTETAMRSCEAFGLRRNELDFANLKFHIVRSVKEGRFVDEPKTPDSHRTEPMSEEMADLLKKWMPENPSRNGWLFESPYTGRPWVATGLQVHHLRPVGEKLGIPNLGWHTFRHTARASLKKLDVPLENQMDFMGHTNPEQTKRYGQDGVDKADELRPVQAKLLEFLRKNGTER